ncbi:hypothetical protein ACG7TL_003686 [Trametes sanguinea]
MAEGMAVCRAARRLRPASTAMRRVQDREVEADFTQISVHSSPQE